MIFFFFAAAAIEVVYFLSPFVFPSLTLVEWESFKTKRDRKEKKIQPWQIKKKIKREKYEKRREKGIREHEGIF